MSAGFNQLIAQSHSIANTLVDPKCLRPLSNIPLTLTRPAFASAAPYLLLAPPLPFHKSLLLHSTLLQINKEENEQETSDAHSR